MSAMETNHKHRNRTLESPGQKPALPGAPGEKETAILVDSSAPFLDHHPPPEQNDDFSDEEEEEEDYETRLQHSSFVGRVVLRVQQSVKRVIRFFDDKFGGHFFALIFLLLYLAYFGYAMYYRFGDEGSVRLLWCTVLGVVIACRHAVWRVLRRTSVVTWCTGPKPPATARRIQTLRFFTRWLLYGGVGAFMGYIIVDVAIKDPEKLRSLPGILVFLLICFLFSTHPSKVNWHTIYWSMGLQFILAVLVMRWQGGKDVMLWIQARLDGFFDNAKPASVLMFGETYKDHYLVFGALPIVFLTNAALSMLYYLGAMQFLVRVIGNTMHFILDTTPIESTGVASSIFMEGVSAILAIRPYLNQTTKSELFALTTAALASIGGAYLAILAQLGVSVEFMLPAMVISAPATFAVCKLVVPENRKPKEIALDAELPPEMRHSSLLEAAQAGAISVITLVANVVASAFSLFALITWINTTLTWFGDRVGILQLTMEKIMSYIFYPLALLMGVELDDCRNVAMLMGFRMSSSSFVAMLKMQQLVGNRMRLQQYSQLPNATVSHLGDHLVLDQWNVTLVDGIISRRSEAIATYALCGFSGILSLFISLSIMFTLIPGRRGWLLSMSLPLLIAGNLANFMVGCFAGFLGDLL